MTMILTLTLTLTLALALALALALTLSLTLPQSLTREPDPNQVREHLASDASGSDGPTLQLVTEVSSWQ